MAGEASSLPAPAVPRRPDRRPIPPERETTPIPDQQPPNAAATDGSVPLARLLEVAVLSPAQAAHVAVELLTTATGIGLGRRCDVRVATPLVTSDGALRAAAATDPGTGTGVDDLLNRLAANARRLPAHPRPHQVTLLRALEEIARSSREPAARALKLRTALDDALGPDAARRLTGELAALVAAFAQLADVRGPRPAPGARRAAPSPVPRPSTSRRDLRARPARRPGPRTAAVALLCLVAVVGGYLALGRPGPSGRPSAAGRPTAAPSSAATHSRAGGKHRRVDVPVLAPRTAGSVRGVSLQRSGRCRTGGPCVVRVTVRLTPTALAQTVGWRVAVVRACTRHLGWSLPTTVTAQPGWTHVYADSTVHLPAGHPAALVAVTSAPARAQSPPDRPAGASSRC